MTEATVTNVKRFTSNPLISSTSSPRLGSNINGPSIIRVPGWLPNPLGKYYLYFSSHSGAYIRLAYANYLQGPWAIYEEGTLHLNDTKAFKNHIASPDVHVDDTNQQIRMYFHGVAKAKAGQYTGVAYSKDGIHFSAKQDILGKSYFRVWKYNSCWYAIAKNNNQGWGELYRATHPDSPFELRGNFLEGMRHAAVLVDGHTLQIWYTRVGDAPERVLMTKVDMLDDWMTWTTSGILEILRPAEAYEGVNYTNAPSAHGSCVQVQQLRDPCVIRENKKTTLFYTGAGESNICGAEIIDASNRQPIHNP